MFIPGFVAGQGTVAPPNNLGKIWNLDTGYISTGVWTSVCSGVGSPGGAIVGVGSDGEAFLYYGDTYSSITTPTASAWSCVRLVNTGELLGPQFLACATGGQLMACAYDDYTSWSSKTASTSGVWTGIASHFSENIVVVVGSDGSVMTSDNLDTWTTRTAASASAWQSVAYCFGTTFIAVASDGDVMTSLDGINWTSRTAASASPWVSVCWFIGTDVAVAVSSNGDIMTSPDGITWTTRTSPTAAPFTGVSATYFPDTGVEIVVAVASDGSAIYSEDAINWFEATTPGSQPWTSVSDPWYGATEFYAVASDGSVMKTT